jgi:hypothetical protein
VALEPVSDVSEQTVGVEFVISAVVLALVPHVNVYVLPYGRLDGKPANETVGLIFVAVTD